MKTILGIDQGSTNTRAALSDLSGCLLGYGEAQGACHAFSGMDFAMQCVREAVQQALDRSGTSPEEVILVYGGLTGVDWPEEYPLLQENIRRLGYSENVHVTNDSIIAMRGGTDQPYGAILIAGSGANCAIRAPDGRTFIYHYYHDEDLQGGQALGMRAIRAVLRSATFREPETSLTRRVLEVYNVQSVDELLRGLLSGLFEGQVPYNTVKELAPIVFEEAYAGDQVAANILRSFGEGLAELVTAGLEHFDMTRMGVEVVLSGSIFKGVGPLLVESIAANLHRVAPKARLVNARYEPVVGAVLLGLEANGVRVDSTIKANIGTTARKFGLVRNSDEGGDA